MSCTPVGLQGPYMERQRANAPQITPKKGNSSVMRRIGGKCQRGVRRPYGSLGLPRRSKSWNGLMDGPWRRAGSARTERGLSAWRRRAGRKGWSDLAWRQMCGG
jgi:hypothetical protein